MELESQLVDKDLSLNVTQLAKNKIQELGFDIINGARPMAKVIQEKIKIPISEIILKSKKISGVIQVDYSEVNDTFVVEVNEKISVKQTTP